jgi:hypothetical protein
MPHVYVTPCIKRNVFFKVIYNSFNLTFSTSSSRNKRLWLGEYSIVYLLAMHTLLYASKSVCCVGGHNQVDKWVIDRRIGLIFIALFYWSISTAAYVTTAYFDCTLDTKFGLLGTHECLFSFSHETNFWSNGLQVRVACMMNGATLSGYLLH